MYFVKRNFHLPGFAFFQNNRDNSSHSVVDRCYINIMIVNEIPDIQCHKEPAFDAPAQETGNTHQAHPRHS